MKLKLLFVSIIAIGILVSLSAVGSVSAVISNASIEAVSKGDADDNPNAVSSSPATSGTGRYIAFQSQATNLVSASTNGMYQIYVKDRIDNDIRLVSVSMNGSGGNKASENPRISNNGRYVVFESTASDLVLNDTNNKSDIFRSDLTTGTIIRVSTSTTGGQANDDSSGPDISSDGNRIVFHSFATTILSGITNTDYGGIYTKDISTGLVQLISKRPTGTSQPNYTTAKNARISCDGQTVVFDSAANNIVEGDAASYDPYTMAPRQRIYVVDMSQSPIVPMYINPNTDSQAVAMPSISCDGAHIAFLDSGTNIEPSHHSIGNTDVYVYNRATGAIELASVDYSGNKLSIGTTQDRPTISGDGNFVVYSASATFDDQDYNMTPDVYMRDRVHGTTELLSRNSNGDVGDSRSFGQDISADGHYIAFRSNSTNLVPNLGASYGMAYIVKNNWVGSPSGLHITTPTNQPSLSWDTVSNAVTYEIYRDGTKVGTSATTTYIDEVSPEGSHVYHVIAIDNEGTKSAPSVSVAVVVDKTNPQITATVNATPNSLGWNNAPVTITFHCSDAISGIDGCTNPIAVSADGAGQSFVGTAVDKSGNTSSISAVVSIDGAKPIIMATRSINPNANGWNNTNVTISYACADGLSGVSFCSNPTVVSTEGDSLSATGTVIDNADNDNSVTLSQIKIDKTAPTAANATISNGFIFRSANVTLGATVSDNLSGVTGGEFYIDTDPGHGSGTSMTYSGGKLSASKTISNLTFGQHEVFIRSKDAAGNWSAVTSVTFFYF